MCERNLLHLRIVVVLSFYCVVDRVSVLQTTSQPTTTSMVAAVLDVLILESGVNPLTLSSFTSAPLASKVCTFFKLPTLAAPRRGPSFLFTNAMLFLRPGVGNAIQPPQPPPCRLSSNRKRS